MTVAIKVIKQQEKRHIEPFSYIDNILYRAHLRARDDAMEGNVTGLRVYETAIRFFGRCGFDVSDHEYELEATRKMLWI